MSRKKTRETLVMTYKKKQKYPQPLKEDDKKLTRTKTIVPKNTAQQIYMNSFNEASIIFGLGSAGTGKTFIATYMAVQALLNSEIDKIVVCRPVVEAGEKLGFLPGTLDDKIHPYLLPLLDAFDFFLGPKMTKDMMKNGIIEVAPLAFMRGRTFSNCFAILDEAQNTSTEQMKMFLTRMGRNSKFSINGDPRQCDLPRGTESGLRWAADKLSGVDPKITVTEFSNSDVIREPIVGVVLNHLEN